MVVFFFLPAYGCRVSSDLKRDVDAFAFILKYKELQTFAPLPS